MHGKPAAQSQHPGEPEIPPGGPPEEPLPEEPPGIPPDNPPEVPGAPVPELPPETPPEFPPETGVRSLRHRRWSPFSWLRDWRRRRILRRYRIPAELWRRVLPQIRAARHLGSADAERLRDAASLFLHAKSLEPAGGLVLSDAMRARIAGEAAVPILNLDLEYYRNFWSVVVYKEAYVARDLYRDGAGVVHAGAEARAGEAWLRGPVVISWEDVADGSDGFNVVIHEMAHKLDMLDGAANGRPPMQHGMVQADWTAAFSTAFAAHTNDVAGGRHTEINAYAATNPAEFFAVVSELFFETPRRLQAVWPSLYEQLALYYRQRP